MKLMESESESYDAHPLISHTLPGHPDQHRWAISRSSSFCYCGKTRVGYGHGDYVILPWYWLRTNQAQRYVQNRRTCVAADEMDQLWPACKSCSVMDAGGDRYSTVSSVTSPWRRRSARTWCWPCSSIVAADVRCAAGGVADCYHHATSA